jgi:hypothetical protein
VTMRSKKLLLTVGFSAILLPALCLASIMAVTVRLHSEGDMLVFAVPASENAIFTISYLHSVEKSMVQGIFSVNSDKQLLLMETRMESVGTGLPIEAHQCTGRHGTWRVAGGDPMVLPELRFRHHRMNNLRMEYNGNPIPAECTREDDLIILKVEKISVATYLFHLLSTCSMN